MKHPLQWLPEHVRKPLFWIFLAWTLVLMLLFQLLNRPLSTPAAPMGIISMQLAWTAEKTSAILSSWGATAREYAAFGLGFDYLFMPVYAAALALGSLLATGRHPGLFARLGSWIGLACFLAAILDGLENMGQFLQLFSGQVDLSMLIGIFALGKFSLILLGILYGLAGWLWPGKRAK
jgi:hypothetical protein